jgi:hypothetical protein
MCRSVCFYGVEYAALVFLRLLLGPVLAAFPALIFPV